MSALERRLVEADVIGIGEHAHGDTVSWGWRLAIVEKLLEMGYAVTIACENTDFYLQNSSGLRLEQLDGDGSKWMVDDESGRFYPSMLPFSDITQWQFCMTKEFSKLPVEFIGTDVQQLSFGFMRQNMGDAMRSVIAASPGVHKRWIKAENDKVRRGGVRNELNAQILFDLKMKNKNKNKSKLVYFAHNEHVALAAHQTRISTTSYRTDGSHLEDLLRRHNLTYLSIGTFSPELWNTWGNTTPTKMKTPVSARLEKHLKDPHAILYRESFKKDGDDMREYGLRDFHVTLVQPRSPSMKSEHKACKYA